MSVTIMSAGNSRRRGVLYAIVLVLYGAWLAAPVDAAQQRFSSNEHLLEVVMMDVDQGDGIFIRTPGGKHLLIDVGPNAGRGVLPFLRSRRIRRIDAMVLTHPHSDHIGGAIDVMSVCDVKEVLDSGREHTTSGYAKILEMIQQRGIRYTQPRAGQTFAWDPALKVTILHPDHADYENINDNSIMIRIEYNRISFLFTGDAEEEAEDAVLGRFGGAIKSDVLKVGHHGSHTSSKPAFLDAVRPRYALISCGYRNDFDHPRAVTLEHLESIDARILRTDLDGFLMFKTDGRDIRWSRSQIPFPQTNFDPGEPEDLHGDDWSGTAQKIPDGITLSASAGENLWANQADAPRWSRPLPSSTEWSCAVAVTPTEERKTEGGLMLFQNAGNFILFGIQEGRLTSFTIAKKGRITMGPEMLVHRPSRIGIRRSDELIEALAYDDEKKTWRVIWAVPEDELPRLSDKTQLGLYAKSWGNNEAVASFRSFKLKSGE